jgi:hypothetical protein
VNDEPFRGLEETERLTPTEERYATTDLFAAMSFAAGEVLYDTRRSNKVTDVIAFFSLIDLHAPPRLEVDVGLDNLSAHKAEPIATWLAHRRRARCHLHFTPTSYSCPNLPKGRLSFLTQRRLGRGAFSSVDDLLTAIETSPEHWNYDRDSLIWNKPPNEIISDLKREPSTLASLKSPACRQPRPDTTEPSNGDTL